MIRTMSRLLPDEDPTMHSRISEVQRDYPQLDRVVIKCMLEVHDDLVAKHGPDYLIEDHIDLTGPNPDPPIEETDEVKVGDGTLPRLAGIEDGEIVSGDDTDEDDGRLVTTSDDDDSDERDDDAGYEAGGSEEPEPQPVALFEAAPARNPVTVPDESHGA